MDQLPQPESGHAERPLWVNLGRESNVRLQHIPARKQTGKKPPITADPLSHVE
jgi:hypothetical protein